MKTLIIKNISREAVEIKKYEKLLQGWTVKIPINRGWCSFWWKVILEKQTQ